MSQKNCYQLSRELNEGVIKFDSLTAPEMLTLASDKKVSTEIQSQLIRSKNESVMKAVSATAPASITALRVAAEEWQNNSDTVHLLIDFTYNFYEPGSSGANTFLFGLNRKTLRPAIFTSVKTNGYIWLKAVSHYIEFAGQPSQHVSKSLCISETSVAVSVEDVKKILNPREFVSEASLHGAFISIVSSEHSRKEVLEFLILSKKIKYKDELILHLLNSDNGGRLGEGFWINFVKKAILREDFLSVKAVILGGGVSESTASEILSSCSDVREGFVSFVGAASTFLNGSSFDEQIRRIAATVTDEESLAELPYEWVMKVLELRLEGAF